MGNEGDDATEVISPFIGDDQLYDALYASGKKNPNGDARPIIKKHLKVSNRSSKRMQSFLA